MIKLNGKDVPTSRPKNLDERLVSATGCSSAEIDTILAAGPDRAAAALRPFLAEGVLPGIELNRAIAADPGALVAIRELYAKSAESAVAATPAPQGDTK